MLRRWSEAKKSIPSIPQITDIRFLSFASHATSTRFHHPSYPYETVISSKTKKNRINSAHGWARPVWFGSATWRKSERKKKFDDSISIFIVWLVPVMQRTSTSFSSGDGYGWTTFFATSTPGRQTSAIQEFVSYFPWGGDAWRGRGPIEVELFFFWTPWCKSRGRGPINDRVRFAIVEAPPNKWILSNHSWLSRRTGEGWTVLVGWPKLGKTEISSCTRDSSIISQLSQGKKKLLDVEDSLEVYLSIFRCFHYLRK